MERNKLSKPKIIKSCRAEKEEEDEESGLRMRSSSF
jgi:hypothetical protein